jgi:hypothetical protein
VILAGVGKASRKAKNQSLRLLPRKRSISGKIQRQIVRQDTMLDLGLGPGDCFMRLRQAGDLNHERVNRLLPLAMEPEPSERFDR